jgi:hypothetical protein
MQGNTGTDPNTQFIGTADSADVVMKVNNGEVMRLKDSMVVFNSQVSLPGLNPDAVLINDSSGIIKSMEPEAFQRFLFGWRPDDCHHQSIDPNLPQPTPTWTASEGKITTCPNVGIGLVDPQYPLDVNGAVNATDFFKNGQWIPLLEQAGTNGDACLSNAKLGIGTCNPETPLHISGNSATITLSDPQPLSGNAPSNTKIQAANGAMRLVSDNSFMIFIDSDNNQPEAPNNSQTEYFRIATNAANQSDPNEKDLLYIDGTGATYLRDLYIQLPANGARYPDFVFEEGYSPFPMDSLNDYLTANKHLPYVPSEAEVKSAGGIPVKELLMGLLRSQEEQVLYILTLKQEIEILKNELRCKE